MDLAHPADGAADSVKGAVITTVGVGPWDVERPGEQLPSGDQYDPELLSGGDTRNVADEFRYWSVDAIRAELDRRREAFRPAELHVAIENWAHDFNIGSVVRTANAFNAAGVHIVGRRKWNRRGAMVTERYLHVHHHADGAALAQWASDAGLTLVGIDNVAGSEPIERFRFPEKAVLLFGQESTGLTSDAQAACSAVVHITQHGSTRSLNAGAAGAIAMFAWAQQNLV